MNHGFLMKYLLLTLFLKFDNSVIIENLTGEANNFLCIYADDIEDTFPNECIHFRAILQNSNLKMKSSIEMLELIVNDNLNETFPNISFRSFNFSLYSYD